MWSTNGAQSWTCLNEIYLDSLAMLATLDIDNVVPDFPRIRSPISYFILHIEIMTGPTLSVSGLDGTWEILSQIHERPCSE